MKNKGIVIVVGVVVFLILNVFFISALAGFVFLSSSNAGALEQAYAKQIALLVDNAKPGMTIILDMEEPIRSFGENRFDEENLDEILKKEEIREIVKVDNENKEIRVRLTGKGGYKFSYFSDNFVETSFSDNKFLRIRILENEIE